MCLQCQSLFFPLLSLSHFLSHHSIFPSLLLYSATALFLNCAYLSPLVAFFLIFFFLLSLLYFKIMLMMTPPFLTPEVAVIHSHWHLLTRAAPQVQLPYYVSPQPCLSLCFIFSSLYISLSLLPFFFNFHLCSAVSAATCHSHRRFVDLLLPRLLLSSPGVLLRGATSPCFTLTLAVCLSFSLSSALSLPAPGCVP